MKAVSRFLATLTAGLLTGLLISCHDMGPEPSPPAISNILPLTVGNKWLRFTTPYDSLGRVGFGSSHSIELQGDTVVGEQRWVYYALLGRRIAYSNTEAGALVRLVTPNQGDQEGIQYKQPCSPGEIYPFATVYLAPDGDYVSVDSIYICTVKSVDTLITVPAGTFHCIHYFLHYAHERDGLDSFDEFLAPGVGWIKAIKYFAPSPGRRPYVFSITETTSIELH